MKWKFWGKDEDKDNPFGHIDPPTLATAMVAIVIDRETAINRWRDQGDHIPESHEDFVEISVHVYQLCIFLDLLERRFGSDVADKVKSHIISTMTTGKVAIGRFFQAVWAGRAKPERDQFFADDTACQVDCNVSRAFLDVISGTQTEKDAIYPLLAKCLSKARVLAEIAFGDLVEKVEFRPETIVSLRKPGDIPISWSEKCGCFERQLQRRHMNPLFPLKSRVISRAELLDASIKDWNDLKQLETEVNNFFSEATNVSKQDPSYKATYSNVLHLREPFERLIFRAAEIGDIASHVSGSLRNFYKSVEQLLRDGCPPEDKAELDNLLVGSEQYRNRWTNKFVKQMKRADTPITGLELIPSLLTEDVETVRLFASSLEEGNRKSAYDLAVTLISDVQSKGYAVPQAGEKLQALKNSGTETSSS